MDYSKIEVITSDTKSESTIEESEPGIGSIVDSIKTERNTDLEGEFF